MGRPGRSAPPEIDAEDVANAFASVPPRARKRLLELRALLFEVATETSDVGPLEETLKWGEPAYLTSVSGSGTTVRLGWNEKAPERVAVLVHCQTTLVDTFRTLHPELCHAGNRAIHLDVQAPIPKAALRRCLTLALTYKRDRRAARQANR